MHTLRVKHTLPNRIRFSLPAVRNAVLAHRLETSIQKVEGIHWIRINPHCAGVVVRFDAAVLSETEVTRLLARHLPGGREV